ncbi:MAG: hypothetical protein ABIH47_09170 [Candidatus Omnitrophota bacterium]
MSFKDAVKQDAYTAFLNTSEFAEVVTYTPHGGAAKSVKAIVDRGRLEPAAEDHGRVLGSSVEILIANDADYGVVSVNKGNDAVALKKTLDDESDTVFFVADVLSHDEGMWHLLLRE